MFAYLDPASGSMILSVLAGGIAGMVVFFKSFGGRIWSTIAFWKDDEADTSSTPSDGHVPDADTDADDVASAKAASES